MQPEFRIGVALSLGFKALRRHWLRMLLLLPLAVLLYYGYFQFKMLRFAAQAYSLFAVIFPIYVVACWLLHQRQVDDEAQAPRLRIFVDGLFLVILIIAIHLANLFGHLAAIDAISRIGFGMVTIVYAILALLFTLWFSGRLCLATPMVFAGACRPIAAFRQSWRDSASVQIRLSLLILIAFGLAALFAAGVALLWQGATQWIPNAIAQSESDIVITASPKITYILPSIIYIAIALPFALVSHGTYVQLRLLREPLTKEDVADVFG